MFYADLHIHSKYSRATSKECDLEHLSHWARRKGIALIATGDFTHPKWFEEIQEKLVPAEPGLFRLREDLEREVQAMEGDLGGEPTRFILEVEISTIYKKGDKTRKVHHLVYAPDLETAGRFNEKLDRIGNIKSDGRPILGLDSRDLLEIALESGDDAWLIPAHIWTPWFAVLGSKSGFDAIEDCYDDLSSHIFALETGLSSDPPMNWRLSSLDRYALVSNSDAHSPGKLGRECCRFDCSLDYFAIRKALETREGYLGTIEFFPEEGKYHMDGHRKCSLRLSPEETRAAGGRCPDCGGIITVGVMHRVSELADRSEDEIPETARSPYRSLIPLQEVLGEILGVGPQSKTVGKAYEALLGNVGPELQILEHVPVEEVKGLGQSVLAEAIERMRSEKVLCEAGYDGEYGVIKLFEKDELQIQKGAQFLFDNTAESSPTSRSGASGPKTDATPAKKGKSKKKSKTKASEPTSADSSGLDADQLAAAQIVDGPVVIIAGPGTGKTRTLTHRIAHLVADKCAKPESCLAITFTNRAAEEMRERLGTLLKDDAHKIPVMTFHAFGLSILREQYKKAGLPRNFRLLGDRERIELITDQLGISERKATRLLSERSKRKSATPPSTGSLFESVEPSITNGGASLAAEPSGKDVDASITQYESVLREQGLVDFDDLIQRPLELLSTDAKLAKTYRDRYRWVSVDEFQDIDENQYQLIRTFVPADGNLCVIGDPDQAIYGFRGSDVRIFQRFTTDHPSARVVQLTRNYRSGKTIVDASLQIIAPSTLVEDRVLDAFLADENKIVIQESPTDRAEAEFVVHSVEKLIGGSTFFSFDSGRTAGEGASLSFSDIAVLYRTDAQAACLCEAFARSGMPFQKRSHGKLEEEAVLQGLIERLKDATSNRLLVDRLMTAAETIEDEDVRKETMALGKALRPLAERFGEDLDGFLSSLALGVDADLWDPRANRVSLLTLHAAKGLEFPVVFIVGCEQGILPLAWGDASEADIDEERRLFFVGMTRAQDRLFLSYARRRLWRGTVRDMERSPYLQDIEDRLLERQKARGGKGKKKDSRVQLELF